MSTSNPGSRKTSANKRGPLLAKRMPWEDDPKTVSPGRTGGLKVSPKSQAAAPSQKPLQANRAPQAKAPQAAGRRAPEQRAPPPKPKPEVEEEEVEEEERNNDGDDGAAPQMPDGPLFPSHANFGDERPPDDLDLVKCDHCGRSFMADRIAKHKKICSKPAKKRRPVYNATKARLDAEALKILQQSAASAPPEKAKKKEEKGGIPKWKLEHEYFIRNIKAAKGDTSAADSGDPLPPPPPDPNLVQCPTCGRRFNEKAAERHIPQCAKLKTKPVAGKPPPPRAPAPAAAARKQEQPAGARTTTAAQQKRGGPGGSFPSSLGGGGGATTPSPGGGARKGLKEAEERVSCPHCSRQFDKKAFLRHVDICAKVVNKPKPKR